jgi:hypothetical protein
MHNQGTAYVLKWEEEDLPDFIQNTDDEKVLDAPTPTPSEWRTLHISGGRRDKISKGDIAGLFLKQGELSSDQLGVIELKQDCAYVSVNASQVDKAIEKTNNTKLKKRKVRVSEI